MRVTYRCPNCGKTYTRAGIEGIPFWILVGIPWFIGVLDIINRVLNG